MDSICVDDGEGSQKGILKEQDERDFNTTGGITITRSYRVAVKDNGDEVKESKTKDMV